MIQQHRMKVSKQFKVFLTPNHPVRSIFRRMFLYKNVLKKCSKFTGEHPFRSVILIKFQSSFIEITLQHGCSPVNALHIFRTPFPYNTSGRLLVSGSNSLSASILKKCTVVSSLPISYLVNLPFNASKPSTTKK